VVDELEWLMNRYQPDMAWLADDVFTIHPGWLDQYAAEMKRRRLRIPFECISRADRLPPRVLDTLAELGCFRIWIGSESGSQRVLDAMERGVTVEQVGTAVALAKARGIKAGMFLMWGYEGEELEDIEATVEHVKRTDPDVFFTTVSYPIKGTPYFEAVSERVVSTDAWAESSDRDFRIRGRHSRDLYQYAEQLLRSEVELHRRLNITHGNAGTSIHALSDADSMTSESSDLGALRDRIADARHGLQASFAEVEA